MHFHILYLIALLTLKISDSQNLLRINRTALGFIYIMPIKIHSYLCSKPQQNKDTVDDIKKLIKVSQKFDAVQLLMNFLLSMMS